MAERCSWCGKEIRGPVTRDGGLIFGTPYCSKKCMAEAKASKSPSSSSNSYEVEKEKPGFLSGLFGLIWKIVKWILIFLAVLFVYDNYIKGDSPSTRTESVSSSSSKGDNGTVSNALSKENTANYSDIQQVAVLWSNYHNSQDINKLMTLYAPQVYYYHSNYSKQQIKASKERYIAKYPQLKQEISNFYVEKTASDYKISFDKKVWTDLQSAPKVYPSYLHVKMMDGSWKIVNESDLITDKNLSKKK